MKKLFESFQSEHLPLRNHIVMAPLTRSRAVGNVPNELMATYYAQRAEAGLIITEGTSPSANGLGYPNIPAIYSEEQIIGWKKITDAVHEKGGKIFLQIMHTGRVSHELNLPEGGEMVAPSAIVAAGDMFTLEEGLKPHGMPKEMTLEDIKAAQAEYVQAAKNAIEAGFDGVELHSANGYLPNQFLNPKSNKRPDEYGGSIENRTRFGLETMKLISDAIGAHKTAIRLSPYGVFNDMEVYEEIPETYGYFVRELDKLNIAYLHVLNVQAMGAEHGGVAFLQDLVKDYQGVVMFNGGLGYDIDAAEALVKQSDKYIVSIGAPFIANPDLINRLKTGAPLAEPDKSTFYTPGEQGYIDYPTLEEIK